MKKFVTTTNGFSLIEVIVVIVVMGILASVAMKSMTATVDDVRLIKTEREMEMLAHAITGNPALQSGGTRSDFGYVGDVGAFPVNIQALYQNPGLGSWEGPYLTPGIVQDSTGFKLDEWGVLYNYSGGITITSTGSGSTITKKIADAAGDYLLNNLSGDIKDVLDSEPGAVYKDSIDLKITVPNGSGGMITKTYNPDSAGVFVFDSLPVGTHLLKAIYTPTPDSLVRYITILPRHKSSANYRFANTTFSGGGSEADSIIYEEFTEAKRSSSGSSLTISIPPGTSGGDLLIAAVVTDARETISAPGGEGWALINQGDGSNAVTLGVWWKLADASESASHQFTWGSNEEAYGWIMRFTGHNPISPINESQAQGGTNTSNPASPAVMTTVANTMIVRIGGFDDDDITTDSTGLGGHTAITMDESSWGSGTCSGGAGYIRQAIIGSSGTSSFQLTASEQYRCVTVAIAPAS